jgi:circadian clock protein KaiC
MNTESLTYLSTGLPNLDAILGGGVAEFSLTMLAGQPGTGKTLLAQQMLFSHIRQHPQDTALYLSTISEPSLKVVRYMQRFDFFDETMFDERVLYRDIGAFIRDNPLTAIINHILQMVRETRPRLLVIDSFRAIRDIAETSSAFRRFCYDLSMQLSVAGCTTFLVGEYERSSLAEGVEFAIADGIFYLAIETQQGNANRVLQIYKMRGQNIPITPFTFTISNHGLRMLNPGMLLHHQHAGGPAPTDKQRRSSGIGGLDAMLQGGFLNSRAIIVSGISGTGKTTFALQFLVQGALQGERGLLFSFEETPENLHIVAASFGWNLADLEAQDLLRIVFISQAEIHLEKDLEQMILQMQEFEPQRFVLDSFSVFVHEVPDTATLRKRAFQVATMVRRAGAVGLLISDVPAGNTGHLSRASVEETVVDGTIVLASELHGQQRWRYLEIAKMRATNHVPGRHRLEITPHGIEVLYHSPPPLPASESSPALEFAPVRPILRGNIHHGFAWLVEAQAGLGRSTLAYQFLLDGLRQNEAGLLVAADLPAYQAQQAMHAFGFHVDDYLASGRLVILDAFSEGPDNLDLSDPARFLFALVNQVERMPRPLRVVVDSLVLRGATITTPEFVAMVQRKNRLLRQPAVSTFDTLLHDILSPHDLANLVNAFDVVVSLHTPDWGRMGVARGSGYHVLEARKAPLGVDGRPYPYTIVPGTGLLVQHDFYHHMGG